MKSASLAGICSLCAPQPPLAPHPPHTPVADHYFDEDSSFDYMMSSLPSEPTDTLEEGREGVRTGRVNAQSNASFHGARLPCSSWL